MFRFSSASKASTRLSVGGSVKVAENRRVGGAQYCMILEGKLTNRLNPSA